ncbi:extracellular solute-binding protein [Sinorhizobium medicae]|uniref:extracellular solute-binding protein n=1 Tax=Sinorhizobium medicae TaxID=110321 RepID=UPI00299DDBF2|nr:extracellular solute-binding protein [Sinorhizobium medicae]MDX0517106.1 extracellular solute-binding protein [Sinorhizobium medicae]MDX0565746.1 extracellular solute-binding protein [Sinorhizobium medicae]MDX0578149.1 extracellular solute-binding protein [Sinorhizobium medicae]MDX0727710.1 extracellular solute-binding protein [Sinorhizobium medicae]MDX0733919.1 extracellular solute-binding protein [Sinorhizobium medicae]
MNHVLKGMTWNHPRGYDPMVACSRAWQEKSGVEIQWEKRSLQDFETFPVEVLARDYDLIVIDHPHVGQITSENCLLPLDVPGREADRQALSAASVGPSYRSYEWNARQWAFPIDAATQVQAWRPDRTERLRTWREVLDLARSGGVVLPLRPPHSLMSFFTLCGNLGRPCRSNGQGDLVDAETGATAIELLKEIAALVDPVCFDIDPIAAFEAMAEEGAAFACAPLIYGYVSYSMAGFRPALIRFGDIPEIGGAAGPVGSALGGTGIAVSAFSKAPEQAIDFAYWVASGDVQRGIYAACGGQPGHGAAWQDETVNAATHDFYRATRATLEAAWLRPRHDGYMAFQQAGSDRLNEGLRRGERPSLVAEELNRLFRKSFR